ncbi:MAG: hypothetical protein V8R51_08110, partial [Clostridia bacterium]
GFLFRNADTLPLSSNTRTMIKFMQASDIILRRGDFILIYPRQSLWWNYDKPKPLKNGAYKLAARSNVRTIPVFITLTYSDIIGEDGFPIKEYYVHIEEPDIQISTGLKKKMFRLSKTKISRFGKVSMRNFMEFH